MIGEIIREFRGVGGFTITAPVFECYGPAFDDLLRKEVSQHILNGLFGQTVIHPRHIRHIRDLYKVSPGDLESARGLKAKGSAVVGLNDRMDEYTTHWRWADLVLERHRVFGEGVSDGLCKGLGSPRRSTVWKPWLSVRSARSGAVGRRSSLTR